MAQEHTDSLARLIEKLCRLPGIGARSAERIALYLLDATSEEVLDLTQVIGNLKKSIRLCRVCFLKYETEVRG